MFFVYIFCIIILGLIFWSFWSVLLSRLEKKQDRETIKSILIGRSQCPKCKKTLKAKELIPLFSYLRQRGRCGHCQTHISREYPILEIISALVFLITYISFYNINSNFTWYWIENLIFWLGTNWLLTLLIVHDIKSFELHIPIRILLMIRIRWREIKFGIYKEAIIGAIICLIFFLAIYYFWKRYVKKRFNTDEEGFWAWDIFIWVALWTMFPFIWNLHQIPITRITGVEMTALIIIIGCIMGIIYFLWEAILKKPKAKTNKQEDIFTERRETNKIIPFIPALIVAFWILLYKGDIILSLIF